MSIRQFSLTIAAATIQNLRTTNVTQTTIALAWDAYPGATAYEVRRNGTLVLTTASTTWTNSGHTAGTTYTLAVRPVVGGTGVASAQASINVTTTGATSYVPTHYVTVNAPTTVSQAAFNAAANPATPCSLVCALTHAVAGNRVQVGPGVYVGVSPNSRWLPAFRPSNSGSSGNPIIFFAQYPASQYRTHPDFATLRSEIQKSVYSDSDESPAFGVPAYSGINFVTWDGLFAKFSTARPGNATSGCFLLAGQGCEARRLVIDMNVQISDAQNPVAIFSQDSVNCRIADNYFVGYDYPHHNLNAVQTYNVNGLTVEHNHFHRTGIFLKGWAHNQAVIRYNYIFGGFSSIEANAMSVLAENASPTLVHNNLIENARRGVAVDNSSNNAKGRWRVYSNTLILRIASESEPSGEAGIHFDHGISMIGSAYYDNIVAGFANAAPMVAEYPNGASVINYTNFEVFNYNRYHNASGYLRWRRSSAPYVTATEYTSLSAWQAASGVDTNSTYGDPQFVNAAGGDYRLQAGSPALTASSTGGPVGCYVTGSETIGIRS